MTPDLPPSPLPSPARTLTQTEPVGSSHARSDISPGHGLLIEAYHSIIQSSGIRFPVAYEFQYELGRGRQGRVFLALRRGARGCVTRHAIKVFDPSIYTSSEQYWDDMGRIASQISALQTMHNPNLLSRDVYEELNGIGYVQMEYIDGIDLNHLLDDALVFAVLRRMPPRETERFSKTIFHIEKGHIAIQPGVAVFIMRQILRGLEALHKKGFVHSDVKPSNVMIDRLGYPRVIDHGRAVKHGEEVRVLLGSPGYMAPEAHQRQPGVTQSDLYSVGLVGLEMLRGVSLMNNANATEAEFLKQKQELPNRFDELLPNYVRENHSLMNSLRTLVKYKKRC